jgi:hypothetical protein
MAVLTGTSGELRFRGVRVGKCREFSLDISRDALETTVLGQWDRTFVEGIRGASGSTTVLYDRDDTATRDLVNSVFRNNDGPQPITLALSTAIGAELDVKAIVTSVSTPVSVGSVIACSVNFQVSGPIGEGF